MKIHLLGLSYWFGIAQVEVGGTASQLNLKGKFKSASSRAIMTKRLSKWDKVSDRPVSPRNTCVRPVSDRTDCWWDG